MRQRRPLVQASFDEALLLLDRAVFGGVFRKHVCRLLSLLHKWLNRPFTAAMACSFSGHGRPRSRSCILYFCHHLLVALGCSLFFWFLPTTSVAAELNHWHSSWDLSWLLSISLRMVKYWWHVLDFCRFTLHPRLSWHGWIVNPKFINIYKTLTQIRATLVEFILALPLHIHCEVFRQIYCHFGISSLLQQRFLIFLDLDLCGSSFAAHLNHFGLWRRLENDWTQVVGKSPAEQIVILHFFGLFKVQRAHRIWCFILYKGCDGLTAVYILSLFLIHN